MFHFYFLPQVHDLILEKAYKFFMRNDTFFHGHKIFSYDIFSLEIDKISVKY